jgi:hypothetical protein
MIEILENIVIDDLIIYTHLNRFRELVFKKKEK